MDETSSSTNTKSFRDSISTIDEQGKRSWIYAQKPKGWYYNARTVLSFFYLLIFFTLPFLKVNGNPLFLFNVIERKFILFSVVFWPQDFFIFGLGMLIFIVFIALFTVIFGRIFCGWACPQTIFMEMVFRKIEYLIEGDASHQKALNKMPWNKEKIIRKLSKHILFFLLSFLIANTFLSYIIGVDKLFITISEPITKHAGEFIALLIFTGIFYGVYSWFREQVCIVVCPYGRMQGVLLDKNSIIVAYDYVRGETRGKYKKNEQRTSGDCIDCFQCVKVCPTNIDIRNGTQLECVNCTACIDACDHMMEKVGLPKGLIRYDSENGIANGIKLKLSPRIIAYSAILLVLIGLESFLLLSRSDLDTTIIRARGMLYQNQPDNKISNLYNIKLINKTRLDMPVTLKLESTEGEIKMVGKDIYAKKESLSEGTFFIMLDKSAIKQRKTNLRVGIYSNNKKIKEAETSFLGPIKK
ncbi:MAG: cytochrome c oxidase accessory protein CcoG [Bacteroidetes bacterium]|nr:cytochrome c oxidase accessory protein CcoG [Bacteroidota bacterium]